jgi:hypothetical protein
VEFLLVWSLLPTLNEIEIKPDKGMTRERLREIKFTSGKKIKLKQKLITDN